MKNASELALKTICLSGLDGMKGNEVDSNDLGLFAGQFCDDPAVLDEAVRIIMDIVYSDCPCDAMMLTAAGLHDVEDGRATEYNYMVDFARTTPCDDQLAASQLRALWTAHALHTDLAPDTQDYDAKCMKLWDCCRAACDGDIPKFWRDFNEFDQYMGEFLC